MLQLCLRVLSYQLYVNYTGAPTTESKTLIIRNLSFDTSEDGLSDAFDSAVKCRLMTHADSGKSKGLVAVTVRREILNLFV